MCYCISFKIIDTILVDLNFESFAFAEIVSIFDTLIRDSQLDSQQPIDQVEFEYTFLDGTIMRLKTRYLLINHFACSNNTNQS